jgi:uncharacterized protein (UPF0303 family)
MGVEEDLVRLKAQEERLQFQRFTEADAWMLGSLMRERAARDGLPIVIDLRCAGRMLFYAAMPGTSPDNEDWVRRKINVVSRFHMSSYRMGRELEKSGRSFDESRGIALLDYAPHGGCFPIRVKDAGVIGTITVSGLPQRLDHEFVVACLCAFLKVPLTDVALRAEAAV